AGSRAATRVRITPMPGGRRPHGASTMIATTSRRWLRAWKDFLAGRKRKRNDQARRAKVQLELERFERREVTNDILGPARGLLTGALLTPLALAFEAPNFPGFDARSRRAAGPKGAEHDSPAPLPLAPATKP